MLKKRDYVFFIVYTRDDIILLFAHKTADSIYRVISINSWFLLLEQIAKASINFCNHNISAGNWREWRDTVEQSLFCNSVFNSIANQPSLFGFQDNIVNSNGHGYRFAIEHCKENCRMCFLVIGHDSFPMFLDTLIKRTPGESSPALRKLGATKPQASFATAEVER